MDQLPLSFHVFRNNILIGVGTLLRMYEIGKKKLLKKSENRYFLSQKEILWVESQIFKAIMRGYLCQIWRTLSIYLSTDPK